MSVCCPPLTTAGLVVNSLSAAGPESSTDIIIGFTNQMRRTSCQVRWDKVSSFILIEQWDGSAKPKYHAELKPMIYV